MTLLGNYQIILVVLLVLNFIFWILVICWRLLLNKSEFDHRRCSNRTGNDNPAFIGRNRGVNEIDSHPPLPYSISHGVELERPPSYEEALKLPRSVDFPRNGLVVPAQCPDSSSPHRIT